MECQQNIYSGLLLIIIHCIPLPLPSECQMHNKVESSRNFTGNAYAFLHLASSRARNTENFIKHSEKEALPESAVILFIYENIFL